ncbi:hypothetical protein B0H17DRAFT_662618 [Mycena rosella]|uniref:Uncharacterized protein n=1 Tax=Mycena rosella TaxID=1033263 RepID=A0AAD7BBY8_MYCRO|nr:hypothetical protein B0H17DRAFT_662618 [Mycena rosella]
MTGRTLNAVYSYLGEHLERQANRAAHRLGLGPNILAARIRDYFARGEQRESFLDELRSPYSSSIVLELEKDCKALIKYALPNESATTQIQAFKSIIMLTTRFPGLRSYFIRSKYIRRVENCEEKIATLWDRPDVPLDTREWSFWRQFSALSLSNGDISAMVEQCSIRELTCSCPTIGAVSVVEQLLVAYDSEGPSKFSGALSIRYLGGILELPSFWHNAGDANDYIVGKLCAKLLLILQDLGLEKRDVDEAPCDYLGVDCLADNSLVGIFGLAGGIQCENDIANKTWYANLCQVVRLLRQPLVEDRLPDSWKRVFSAEFLNLIPLVYEPVEVDIV